MQRLAEGVLRRLRNWEISDQELQSLQQEGKPRRLLAYRSAANGVVLQKPGVQGMRFMPGEVLFEIADLSSVWMLADVSEQDLGLVHVGQEAKLRIVAYPDKVLSRARWCSSIRLSTPRRVQRRCASSSPTQAGCSSRRCSPTSS